MSSVQMMKIFQKKYEVIWTKIKNFKNIELNTLPIYDDRYIKNKIRTYVDNVYTNFLVQMSQRMIQNVNLLQSFLYIITLLVYYYNYYLQVHLQNCAEKIIDKQMTDYLDKNFFQNDKDQIV